MDCEWTWRDSQRDSHRSTWDWKLTKQKAETETETETQIQKHNTENNRQAHERERVSVGESVTHTESERERTRMPVRLWQCEGEGGRADECMRMLGVVLRCRAAHRFNCPFSVFAYLFLFLSSSSLLSLSFQGCTNCCSGAQWWKREREKNAWPSAAEQEEC